MKVAEGALVLCLAMGMPFIGEAAADQTQGLAAPLPVGQTLGQPYTTVRWVVELENGDAIVLDQGEHTLWRVRANSLQQVKVGRVGDGPGEYRLPSMLFRAKHGFVLFDEATKRVTEYSQSGVYTRTYSNGAIAAFRLRGGDSAGRVYYQGVAPLQIQALQGTGSQPESKDQWVETAPILRYEPESAVTDTIGFVRLPPRKRDLGAAVSEAPGPFSPGLPFGEQDEWTVSLSGELFVLRARDYAPEWWKGMALVQKGASISLKRVVVSGQDRENLWKEMQGDSMPLFTCSRNGCRTVSVIMATRPTEWPGTKNPFTPMSLRVGDDGEVWFREEGEAGDTLSTYIAISRHQGPRRYLAPVNARIVGVGAECLYMVVKDEDELEHLQSIPRP